MKDKLKTHGGRRARGALRPCLLCTALVLLAVALFVACSSPSSKQAQSLLCDEAENASPEQLETFFQATRKELERVGIRLDADVWTDPAKFQQYTTAYFKAVGCSDPAAPTNSVSSPLHADFGPDYYCGPGHGLSGLKYPRVSRCLNRACFLHDSCYAACSADTQDCSWRPVTRACDVAMLQTADACDNEFGTKIASFAVRRIAHLLFDIADVRGTDGCAAGMSCPGSIEGGLGICATQPASNQCKECLTTLDSECRERSAEAQDDLHQQCRDGRLPASTCVAADCPDARRCFGVPIAPGIDAGSTVDAAADARVDAAVALPAGSACKVTSQCSTGCCDAATAVCKTPQSSSGCRCQTHEDCVPLGPLYCADAGLPVQCALSLPQPGGFTVCASNCN